MAPDGQGSEESLIEKLHDTIRALESAAAQVLEEQRPKVETEDAGEGRWTKVFLDVFWSLGGGESGR